uniref:Complex I assembly factor TIMMDC1, mitochondrial n=1 Tax=Parascaris univalens TaxID=6257 RepID=A0A914ZW35_PARUN
PITWSCRSLTTHGSMPEEDGANRAERRWLTSLGISRLWDGRSSSCAEDQRSVVSENVDQPTEEECFASRVQSKWARVKGIYTDDDVHMERDVTVKVTQLAFMAGTFVGGMSGYATTKQRYDMYKTGRTFLSARDAIRRKWDYGIVMSAKQGLRVGLRSAALVGSIVLLTTHYTLWRDRFSAWYFPVISASVASVLAFPLGLIGSLKALGLGISSGLSLSAVVVLYAMSMDKTVNEAYGIFKSEYEERLRCEKRREDNLQAFMKEHNIPWRYTAIKKMREEEERRLLEEAE